MNPCDNIDIRICRLLNQTLNRSDSICRFVITNNAVTNGRGNRETRVGTIERVSIRAYIGGRKKKRDRERETAGVRDRGSRAGRCHKTKRDSRNASCFAHSPSLPKFFTEYLYIPRQSGPIFSTIHRTDRTISCHVSNATRNTHEIARVVPSLISNVLSIVALDINRRVIDLVISWYVINPWQANITSR